MLNHISFMKNLINLFVLSLLIISCSANHSNQSEEPVRNFDVEQRLNELGIELSSPSPPTANFLRTVKVGNFVFLSGHGPDKPEGGRVIGKVGGNLSLEQGNEAARLTGISLLSSLKAEIGDLNKVRRFVKVTGMVNADPSFTEHSQVVNGFSDLMVEIFGDDGKHARAAVGMSSLPFNMAVEIEAIVEVTD